MHASVAILDISHATLSAQPDVHSGLPLPFLHLQYIPRKAFPALRLSFLSPHRSSSSWRTTGPTSVTELNLFPSHPTSSTTALNVTTVYIVRLSSPLAFPVAREDALIFQEATMLTARSSSRKPHKFSWRKMSKKDLVNHLAVATASAGQTQRLYTPKA